MSILVLNVGSSSLKFALFSTQSDDRMLRGKIDHSLNTEPVLTIEIDDTQKRIKQTISSDQDRIEFLLDWLKSQQRLDSISLIAHRIVHGGDSITQPTLVDKQIVSELRDLVPLAPLHMPLALEVIQRIEESHPGLKQAVVVDTEFFQSLPLAAKILPLPYELFEKLGIRKFGFHGVSHEYCYHRSRQLLNNSNVNNDNRSDQRMIICHIGSGCSITAMDGGQPIDTSMGFTPLDGLMMATRCGSIDPGVLIYLQKQLGWTIDQIDEMLNQKSGLLGVSECSGDFRHLLECEHQDPKAALAIRMFTDRIQKTIGAFAVGLNGLDCLVFTAGIGENSARLRELVCAGLQCLGVQLDANANQQATEDSLIHASGSRVSVLKIKTQEEAWIASKIRTVFAQPLKEH